VIGQPLVGFDLMTRQDCEQVTSEIRAWLAAQGIAHVDYKGHPKDPERNLLHPDYRVLDLAEPLEIYMTRNPYDAVVGVRSTALLFARQVYAAQTAVVAFGWDRVRFKSDAEREDMRRAFQVCGVVLQ
jgi:hypothetical protein